jgi:hypothetical protein
LERALAEVAGQVIRLEFVLTDDAGPAEAKTAAVARRPTTPNERLAEKAENPLVRRAMELFAARPVRVEEPEPKTPS